MFAEYLNPNEGFSGPILQFLAAYRGVSRKPIEFVEGSFFDHLVLRTCAEHLYTSHTTMNYINHYHPFLKSLFDPCAIQCPLYPPKTGWVRNPDPLIVYRVDEPAIPWRRNWENSADQIMLMWKAPCKPYISCHYPDLLANTSMHRTYEVKDNPTCHAV